MAKYRFNSAQRYVIWSTHGFKCFWCEVPIEFKQVSIDHIIAENLENNPDELISIKKQYKLPDSFVINDFCNWVPAHNNCNSRKSMTSYEASPAFVQILDKMCKNSIIAKTKYNDLIINAQKDKILAKIIAHLESNVITKNELIYLIKFTNDVQEIKGIDTENIHIRVSDRWEIIRIESDGLAVVSDGRMSGITPTGSNPHISWSCSNCGSLGPWNGVMCLSCGRVSDPYD